VLGEWEAWAIAGQQQRWRLVAICPGNVYGPPMAISPNCGALMRQRHAWRAVGQGWAVCPLPLSPSKGLLLCLGQRECDRQVCVG
jgi:hypothetical protein